MDIQKRNNIRVVHLKGTRAERARLHGELLCDLKSEAKESLAFTVLSNKNQTLLKRAFPHSRMLGHLLSRLYEVLVWIQYLRLPKTYRDQLRPFKTAGGITQKVFRNSLFQPDLLMFLASIAGKKARNRLFHGIPGCSTLSVNFKDQIYFLRNLDYPAVGYWEKNPTLFYHEPSEPELQNYVGISSLGVDTAGLTGWNVSGIAFSLHAHFSKRVSLGGLPIFFLGDAILEKARTLDEAIEIAKNFKTIGAWTINLTSFSEKKSVCVELQGGRTATRESKNGILAHSNIFITPEFQSEALHFNESVFQESESRKFFLERAGIELSKDFTWAKGVSVLSSHLDPSTESLRIFGGTVSVINTLQSIGFDPLEKCIYISVRNETPTGHGPYQKFPFSFDQSEFPLASSPLLEPEVKYEEPFMKALHAYYLAYLSWHGKGESPEIALSHLREATKINPHDPHLWLQRGYFELLTNQEPQALECFHHALKEKLSQNLTQVAHYFRGNAHDLLNDRQQAIEDYQAILKHQSIDSRLEQKARTRLKKPFSKKLTKFISPDMQFAEPIDYR